jgi:hypothetical protein
MFENTSKFVKQQMNQIGKTPQWSRKPRTRQQAAQQSEFVQNKSAFLKIVAEMQHCRNSNRNDFGIRNFYSTIFAVSACLEKIINRDEKLEIKLKIFYFFRFIGAFCGQNP